MCWEVGVSEGMIEDGADMGGIDEGTNEQPARERERHESDRQKRCKTEARKREMMWLSVAVAASLLSVSRGAPDIRKRDTNIVVTDSRGLCCVSFPEELATGPAKRTCSICTHSLASKDWTLIPLISTVLGRP